MNYFGMDIHKRYSAALGSVRKSTPAAGIPERAE
jgi:hypothetical protein